MPKDNRSFTVGPGVEVPVPAPGEVWTVGAVVLNGRRGPSRGSGRKPRPVQRADGYAYGTRFEKRG